MLAYRIIRANAALITSANNGDPVTRDYKNQFFVSGSETEESIVCSKEYLLEHFEREVILSKKLGRYVVRRK